MNQTPRSLLVILGFLAVSVSDAESPKLTTTLAVEPPVELSMYADEPVMLRALRRAHQELPGFLEIADTPPRHLVDFSVRVLLIRGPKKEFIWITDFRQTGERSFAGRVNDDVHITTDFKRGDPFTFVRTDIADWMYTDTKSDKVHGAYTECALLTLAPVDVAAKIRRDYKLDCEF
jgi:uncharacterized protein YegJ (DUF2314 family)